MRSPATLRAMSGVSGAKQGEIQAIELRERLVDRDEPIAASQSKRGQICVHPELWGGRISQRELLPAIFQPRGLLVKERDPVVGEERLVNSPCLPVCKWRVAERPQDGGAGKQSEKRLLSRSAKDDGLRFSANVEPTTCGYMKWVVRDCQRQPNVAIAQDRCALRPPAPVGSPRYAPAIKRQEAGAHGRYGSGAASRGAGLALVRWALPSSLAAGTRR